MARRRRGQVVDGWVIVDKPVGLTSTQVVGRVRRLFDAQKAGHAGTLDPLASGVLPIALGEATKTVPYVQDGRKIYRFTVCWGAERTTDDLEGAITLQSPDRPDAAAIQAALPALTGTIMQVPPAFSAIKVDGERAYDLARDGVAVDLAARPARIDRFDLLACPDLDTAEFEVECGKGTYVRALARDLGRALGCLGHVAALRRVRVGPFGADRAIGLAQLAETCDTPAPGQHLLPVVTALDDIPALAMTGPQAERIRHGQSVRVLFAADDLYRLEHDGHLVALASVAGGEIRPLRVFNLQA